MSNEEREEKCVFQFGRSCHALKQKSCEGCRFYKTTKQHIDSRARAQERIHQLDEAQQEYIRQTYYGATAPVEVTP